MWVLSEKLENAITHRLTINDVSIEWAVKRHNYAHPKSQWCEYWVSSKKHGYAQPKSQWCEYWVSSKKNTVMHTLRVEDVSIEWAVKKNTITHILRVEDVSIEYAVFKKHDYAQSKMWVSKMWVLSEQLRNRITYILRVRKMSAIPRFIMICQRTYMLVNTDVTKFKIHFVGPNYLCASINIIFTLHSPVTAPAISR